MAANDYYSGQSSQPYNRPQYLDTRPPGQIANSYSPSYSSSSIDQSHPSLISATDGRRDDYDHSSRLSQFSDTIPLRHQQQTINTNQDDWRTQSNQYANSPESQTAPPLLPKTKTKSKKKDGWFSGKIPWVVYIVSLVQITVFIAEIIQNCKSQQDDLIFIQLTTKKPSSQGPPS